MKLLKFNRCHIYKFLTIIVYGKLIFVIQKRKIIKQINDYGKKPKKHFFNSLQFIEKKGISKHIEPKARI